MFTLSGLGMEYYKPNDLPTVNEGAIFNELGQRVTDWRVFAADTGQSGITNISQLSWAKLHYGQLPPRWRGHTYYRPSATDAAVVDETGRAVSWEEFAAATGQQAIDSSKVNWSSLKQSSPPVAGTLVADIQTGLAYWTDISGLPGRLSSFGEMSTGQIIGFAAPALLAAWLWMNRSGGHRR